MLKRHYRTGQFAKKASVTIRTLRYYDQVGLLSPREHTGSGYRLYTDEDLLTLQHILALKFLGFSLDEIRMCLRRGPKQLAEALAQQRAMMQEKRAQLDAIIRALAETESLLEAGRCDWESVAGVIQAIRMEKKDEWVSKYFTDDQIKTMEELGKGSYSEEARRKLQSRRTWTEEDQQKATADWTRVYSEARRLADAGADPAGPEAQAIAKLKHDLLAGFTQGDPEVSAGLNRFWEGYRALPEERKPFDASPFDAGEAGNTLLERAGAIYAEGIQS
jgi:MerR family transcriptional regulator, thiopeptide resistance regulator